MDRSFVTPINFSALITQMRVDNNEISEEHLQPSFKKKNYLKISLLQTRSDHIEHNKLSDKFTRRDRRFYDLYYKK